MVPLLNLYVQEQFVFLAMKLKPDQGSQDVQPVKITYPGSFPMIPLGLTAVAANDNMAVMIWIFGDTQAAPVNYAGLNIDNEELVFFGFGGSNNCRQLIGEKADEFDGHGFITEYAAPTQELSIRHPLIEDLRSKHTYVTRLNTVISPDEMTVDPIFDFDAQLADVSNIRDISGMKGVYNCEDTGFISSLPVIGNIISNSGNRPSPSAPAVSSNSTGPQSPENADSSVTPATGGSPAQSITVGVLVAVLLAGLVSLGIVMGRRSTRPSP